MILKSVLDVLVLDNLAELLRNPEKTVQQQFDLLLQEHGNGIPTIQRLLSDEPDKQLYMLHQFKPQEKLAEMLQHPPAQLQQIGLDEWYMDNASYIPMYYFPFMIDVDYRIGNTLMGKTFFTMARLMSASEQAPLLRFISHCISTQQSTQYQMRMMLILVLYYFYFDKNRPCSIVGKLLDNGELQRELDLNPNEVTAFQFFAKVPPVLTGNALYDPLLVLFSRNPNLTLDEITLRHVLVNLVAVTVGSAPNTDVYTRMFFMEKLMAPKVLGVGSGSGYTVSRYITLTTAVQNTKSATNEISDCGLWLQRNNLGQLSFF